MNNELSPRDKEMDEILSILGQLPYPQEFLDRYEIYELLAKKDGIETFLATGKNDDKKYVIKCYDSSVNSFTHENELISGLSHSGIPVYVDSYVNDRVLISVREYVDGLPLNAFVIGNPLSENQAANIIIQLCDILTYLHDREEPIIHRDIKPNNIIVRPNGRIVLIDFDIARKYREKAEHDTGILATPGYAPPEQYGFSQTDTRSDIYAMGVLLHWLLTDSEKPSENDGVSDGMRRIIDKCTEFSPDSRYSSAGEVKKALKRLFSANGKNTAVYIIFPILCLLMFGAGLLLGKGLPAPELAVVSSTVVSPTTVVSSTCVSPTEVAAEQKNALIEPQDGVIVFKEPLIEESVRLQVGKTDGEPLTKDDLNSIEAIYIHGEKAYSYWSGDYDGTVGTVSTLEDVWLLPRVRLLVIDHQTLSDISALEGKVSINGLFLSSTLISDVSVLATLPFLDNLNLGDTLVTDLTVLDELPCINHLFLGQTDITLDKIGGRKTLEFLQLFNARYITSYEDFEGFTNLKELTLGLNIPFTDSPECLRSYLPSLERITVIPARYDEMKQVFRGTNVEVIAE